MDNLIKFISGSPEQAATILKAIIDIIVSEAKSDPTLLRDVLKMAQNQMRWQDVIKAHPAVTRKVTLALLNEVPFSVFAAFL